MSKRQIQMELPLHKGQQIVHQSNARFKIINCGRTATTAATIISNVGGKIIKIHDYSFNSVADGQTVFLYEETSGTQVTPQWPNNAREGTNKGFVANPACLGKTSTANKKVLINLAAATFVNYSIIYSLEDA